VTDIDNIVKSFYGTGEELGASASHLRQICKRFIIEEGFSCVYSSKSVSIGGEIGRVFPDIIDDRGFLQLNVNISLRRRSVNEKYQRNMAHLRNNL
jgi:hypothetical protein